MRLKTLENQMRVYMSPSDYQVMLDAAENRRAKMAMRCMGEMGLRVGELDFYWDHIRQSTGSDVEIYFLVIYGKDTKDRDTDGKRREAWVPTDLKEALQGEQFEVGLLARVAVHWHLHLHGVLHHHRHLDGRLLPDLHRFVAHAESVLPFHSSIA